MKLAALSLLALVAAPAGAATIRVTVENVRPNQGKVVVCLWNEPKGFPDCDKSKPLRKVSKPASGATETFTFENVSTGTYAIGVAQDVNGNGRVDTNFVGIPKEPVAMSNGAKGRLGPPSFKSAAFPLADDRSLTIRL